MKVEKLSTVVNYNVAMDESELLSIYLLAKEKVQGREKCDQTQSRIYNSLKKIFEEPTEKQILSHSDITTAYNNKIVGRRNIQVDCEEQLKDEKKEQIDKLADYIMANFKTTIVDDEACDVAINIMRNLKLLIKDGKPSWYKDEITNRA
ncbi:MAG TPA: hypothetical protein VIK72_19260 [Clostridiaceae bacterium]